MESYLDPQTQSFLRYLDLPGSGPPLLFLAGLGLASTAVYPRVMVEPGLTGRHALLVDLFGAGFSDGPESFSYSLEAHAATLAGLLDQAGSPACILVGHSMGGAVAIELAAQRPDLCAELILAEANLHAGGGAMSSGIAAQTEADFVRSGYQDLLDYARRAALDGDSISAIALGNWAKTSPLGLHRSAVGLVRGTQPVMWDNLIRLKMRRAFLFGGHSLEEYEDDRVLREELEANGIPTYVVPQAGHGMMAENPAGFAAAVAAAMD